MKSPLTLKSIIIFTAAVALCVQSSQAEVLLGNIDAPDNPLQSSASVGLTPNFGTRFQQAVSFTTRDQGFSIDELKVRIRSIPGQPRPVPYIAIFNDDGTGKPGTFHGRFGFSPAPLPGQSGTVTFRPLGEIMLEPNTTYHIYLHTLFNTFFGWKWSDPSTVPTGVVDFGAYQQRRNGSPWAPLEPVVRSPRPKFELTGTALDDDGDGIPNSLDFCPNSIMTPTVIIDDADTGVENDVLPDGCTIADLVSQIAGDAKNHGQFVSGITKMCRYLLSVEAITQSESAILQSLSAQSSIGM